MSARYRWHDAEQAVQWLEGRATCAEILRLLARLPLLDVPVLQQLLGLRGGASVYRSVTRLIGAGLVDTVRPPVYRNHSPRLLYLTDLGLATLSLDLQVELGPMVRQLHLHGSDVLALIPRLPDLLAAYELLGALAASRAGRPRLLAWERPWRRAYPRPMGKTLASVTLPAHAVLAWEGEMRSSLLIPDRGVVPPHLFRPTLDRLLQLRRSWDGCLPRLVIATTGRERMSFWSTLLEDMTKARREAPLAAHVLDWCSLSTAVSSTSGVDRKGLEKEHTRPIHLPSLQARRGNSGLPRLVGENLTVSPYPVPAAPLGQTALIVTPAEHDLLELVARHPFLHPGQIAPVLGWDVASVRRRMNRLMAVSLMLQLDIREMRVDGTGELIELTEKGLRLVAAHLGLPLAASVRIFGLTGGGPDHPVGPRRDLLRHLTHTLEADDIFVRFHRQARQQASLGRDDAMLEWQNAAAYSRRHLRPDGYGLYRRHGVSHGFFLELDRGTMNTHDYVKKLAAYYHYGVTRRFEHDYRGYPTILFVAASNAGEERIARVARAVAIGHSARVPLLLTCRWRIDDPNNSRTLLGCIWRTPWADFSDRRSWLPALSAASLPDDTPTSCSKASRNAHKGLSSWDN